MNKKGMFNPSLHLDSCLTVVEDIDRRKTKDEDALGQIWLILIVFAASRGIRTTDLCDELKKMMSYEQTKSIYRKLRDEMIAERTNNIYG